ncbi:MAG: ABC transporter substrate-binding protein [Acidovorax sp.]
MQRATLALLAALGAAPVLARDAAQPVTVNVCGQPQTYTRVPQRAITHDVNITEMFLFLGLADKLAAYSGMYATKEASPQLASVLARVPSLSREMNLENIVAARADFVFGGWSYGFRPGGVTPELLARYGIPSYVLTESCVRVQKRERVALEDAFTDMDNVARIFGVEKQAAPRIQRLRDGLATLRKEMRGNTNQPKVFVFDSGEKSPTTVGRYGMPQAMLEAAGARNIFDDIASNWPKGNWEDVVLRDPEWIVIIDYGKPSAQGKIDFLLQKQELQTVSAIRNKRFFVMTYAEATPGPRNVETAQRLAAALHPDRRITVTPVHFEP